MTAHPSKEDLRHWLDTGHDADPDGSLASHIENCNPCQQELERLTAIGGTDSTPAPSEPSDAAYLRPLRRLLRDDRIAGQTAFEGADLPIIPGYKILGELGKGGMAVVYKAQANNLNRLVALKMLRKADEISPEQFLRFCAEAETLGQLKHQNIVQIYEPHVFEHPRYFTMEFVAGGNLASRIADPPREAPIQAAKLVELLARAIHEAHQCGIVHRDLKPANVLLEHGPEVPLDQSIPKIADFGLAKPMHTDFGLTQSGTAVGTPSYMAPEQAKGKTANHLTDVYALGAILYELLTGRPPFLAETEAATVQQVLLEDPVWPRRLVPEVPRDLETICLKCLHKEPARRYESAAALADDLERFEKNEPILARPVSHAEKTWKWARRHPAKSLSIVFAPVLLIVLLLTDLRINRVKRETEWKEFATSLRTEIEQTARIGKADEERLRGKLALLKTHDAGQAEELRLMLENRLTHLQPLWTLPGDDTQTIFKPGAVTADAAGLARVKDDYHKAPAARVLTLSECAAGGARLEAVFDTSWTAAAELGLELNATEEKSGYLFSLYTVEAETGGDGIKRRPATFRTAREQRGHIELRISRDGVPLLAMQHLASAFPEGTLTLTATREGSELTLKVQGLEPLIFEDLYALPGNGPGRFAMLWPQNVRLEKLEAQVIAKPREPSSLESGNELSALGDFKRALDFYNVEGQHVHTQEVSQEIRYRQGLCLVALNDLPAAEILFKKFAREEGKRWPPAAFVQLWSLYIQQQKMVLADELFDRFSTGQLQSEDLFSKLVRFVPEKTRQDILNAYRKRVPIIHGQYRGHDERITAAQRWVEAEKLIKGNSTQSRFWLSRAHFLAGDEDLALRQVTELCRETAVPPLHILGDRIWLLRRKGEARQALVELVKQARAPSSLTGPGVRIGLALLRAECDAALNEWGQIEEYLFPFVAKAAPEPEWDQHLARAWLMLGFVREHLGDHAGAEKAWREASQRVREATEQYGLLEFLIARSLAGVSDNKDVQAFLLRVANAQPGAALKSATLLPRGEMASVASKMWRTPEGREWARRIVFRDLSVAEHFRKPPTLAAFEFARQHALGGSQDPQHLKVCWQAAEGLFQLAVVEGKVSPWQMLAADNVWKGRLDSADAARVLDPLPRNISGPLAYVAAHRMVRCKNASRAAGYFDLAERYAPKDSPLSRLARADRALLTDKKGLLILHSDAPGKVTLNVLDDDKAVPVEIASNRELRMEVGSYRLQLGKGAGNVTVSVPEVKIALCSRVNVYIHDRGKPASPVATALPGLLASPAPRPGIRRWQLATRESLGGWNSLALSPDGKLLAFAAQDGHVRVKDAKTAELVHFFVGHTAEVTCVSWSPDNCFLASGSWDRTVRVWNIKEDKLHRVLRPPQQPNSPSQQQINALAWNPNGQLLVSGGPKHLRLWDVREGTLIGDEQPDAGVLAIAWSPKDSQFAVVTERKGIQVWKLAGQAGIEKKSTLDRSASLPKIHCVAWHPDGKRIAAGGEQRVVHVWIAFDEKPRQLGDSVGAAIAALAWTKEGKQLAVGTRNGFARLLDGVTGKSQWTSRQCSEVYSLFCSPESSRFLTGHSDHSYRFWNAADGTVVSESPSPNCAFSAFTFDPDGKRLAIGARNGTFRLGDIDGKSSNPIGGFPIGIERIAWSRADRLAVFGWSDEIYLQEADSRMPVEKRISTHSRTIYGIDWSHDGRLASGGDDQLVRIWDADGKEVQDPIKLDHRVRAVAWSPDGKRLAIGLGMASKLIRVFDLQSHSFGPDLRGHTEGILRIQWASDGQRLASSSDDGTVRLWDLRGRPKGPVLQKGERVPALAWSPDDRYLATGDYRGTCRIWTADGTPVREIRASCGPIRSLAWIADGKQLVSGGDDGVVRTWNAQSGEPIQLLVHLPNEKVIVLSPDGTVVYATPKADDKLLYLSEVATGKIQFLTPKKFRER